MNLVGGFAFGLIVGYLTWHVARPGVPNTELNIKTLFGVIGALGGAAILTLFPAGTDLFASYSIGLAIGFFLTSVQQSIRNWQFSRLRQKIRKQENQQAKKEEEHRKTQEEFVLARIYINENLDTLIKVIGQKFIDNPNIDLDALDLPEFPVSVLTKIQILRFFAVAMPDIFYYGRNGHGLRMHQTHIRKDNSFLANPQKVRSKIKHVLPYK